MSSTGPGFTDPHIEAISKITTIFDSMQVLRKICLGYGFRYFSVVALSAGISGPDESLAQLSLISSWPPELIAEYDRLELAKNSPVLQRMREQITPLLIEVDKINKIEGAMPSCEYADTIALFSRFGLRMGVHFPVNDGRGQRHVVSFLGDRKPLTADELSALAMFSTFLVEQVSKITTNSDDSAKSILNAREIEVLRWTAEGKTSAETAKITGLSEHTVNHYATISTQKLGCSNRTQAVVCAMRMGLFK